MGTAAREDGRPRKWSGVQGIVCPRERLFSPTPYDRFWPKTPSRKPSTKHEIPSINQCATHVEMAKQPPPLQGASRVPSPGNGYLRFELVLSTLCSVFRPRMRSTTWRLRRYSYARPFRASN